MEKVCVFFDVGGTLGDVVHEPQNGALVLHPYADTRSLLDATRASDKRLGVISNVPAGMTGAQLAALLDAAGIGAVFEPALIIASTDAGADKPERAIYLYAAAQAGVAISLCTYVGEDADEVAGARAAGMNAQLRTRGTRTMDASNYLPMCKSFAKEVDFNAKSPVGSPAGSPDDAGKLAGVVREYRALLPATYRTGYADPLISGLADAISQLKGSDDARSMVDTLVGAVRDWGEPAYAKPIRRFEAVVSNLYRSFLSKDQRASIGLPLIEVVPPLVTFAPTADDGPFTLPVDAVKELVGARVGVVSLPGSYAMHPLLWPALAHETGGHDVLHADPGLLQELAAGVAKLGLSPTAASLWSGWMDETASDVYGLLNVGPSFAISLSAFFSALEVAIGESERLGTIGTTLYVRDNQPVDPHPIDILRLYVAIGVVASLGGLAAATRQTWMTLIENVATQAAGGAAGIDVFDVGKKKVIGQIPFDDMIASAKKVGTYIATAKLDALDGHSIQDIETWDDSDEAAATAIATALAAGSPIVGLGDDAQLLAGATVALFTDATKYAAITTSLGAGLDDSFARDPVFGTPTPTSALGRGRRAARGTTRTPGATILAFHR